MGGGGGLTSAFTDIQSPTRTGINTKKTHKHSHILGHAHKTKKSGGRGLWISIILKKAIFSFGSLNLMLIMPLGADNYSCV